MSGSRSKCLVAGANRRLVTPTRLASRLGIAVLFAAAALTRPGKHGLCAEYRVVQSAAAATSLHEAILTAQHGDPAKALALTQQLVVKFPRTVPRSNSKALFWRMRGALRRRRPVTRRRLSSLQKMRSCSSKWASIAYLQRTTMARYPCCVKLRKLTPRGQ